MKQLLMSLLFLSFSSLLHASQPMVPILKPHSYRFVLEPVLATDFSGLNKAQIALDFAQKLGGGFEWGTTLQGGAASQQLFFENETFGIIGFDLMGRYFGSITNIFHFGMQLDINYAHNLSGGGNTSVKAAMGVKLSAPFVMHFEDSVAVYCAPAIRAEGSIVNTASGPSSLFAQSVGGSVDIGTVFYTYGPGIYFSMRPTWKDLRAPANYSSDFALGLVFDI